MPEYRECWAHYFFILFFFLFHRYTTSWKLIALWADAVKKTEPGAKKGYVYSLDATSTALRGQHNHQTPLYPPMFRQKAIKKADKREPKPEPKPMAVEVGIPDKEAKKAPKPPTLQDLELRAVSTTNRAIILDLGHLVLKVGTIDLLRFF